MKRFALVMFSVLTALLAHRAVYGLMYQDTLDRQSQYDLLVRILPIDHRIRVTGKWKQPAASAAKDQIEFFLSPKMEGLEVRLLEPKACAPLNLQSSKEDGGDTKWIFKPAQPIPAGQSVLLEFSYTSDGKPAPQFNVSTEGSFAGGGGELWYPQVAYKNREIGTLRFIAPAGETVISNGLLASNAEQRAGGEFIFHVTEPSKFAFASGKYVVARRPGKVPFNLYLLRPRANAQTILEGCARALNSLTNLFGEFPNREFSLVEVNFPTLVRGTSEFGLIFADRSKLDEFDLSYWAHELGHQWWGNRVRSAANTTGQMMLSEGVTQFGALQAIEAVEGPAAAEEFRRSGYHGKGQSAASYFRLIQSGADFPLISYIPKNQDETLAMHQLANTKGFILLDMLSQRIGREKFAAILRRFIRLKTNQTTSWQEFQQAIEVGAGQDIHWFFEQWFARTGAPDYQLTWSRDGKTVRGVIKQPAPHFRATLEVEINGNGHRLLRTIDIVGGLTEFNWRTPFIVNSVTLDPHFKVLRWLPEFRTKRLFLNDRQRRPEGL